MSCMLSYYGTFGFYYLYYGGTFSSYTFFMKISSAPFTSYFGGTFGSLYFYYGDTFNSLYIILWKHFRLLILLLLLVIKEVWGGKKEGDAILRPIGYTSERATYPSRQSLPCQPSSKPYTSGRVTWPSEPHLSRSKRRMSGRFTLKNRNWRKICRKIIFPKVSFKTRMYNQLIKQLNSISKICKDIIES
jgi:hypothetical protein